MNEPQFGQFWAPTIPLRNSQILNLMKRLLITALSLYWKRAVFAVDAEPSAREYLPLTLFAPKVEHA